MRSKEKVKTQRILNRKFIVSNIGLVLLAILLVLKPAVNNSVTKFYYIASIIGLSVLIILFTLVVINKNQIIFNITFEWADFLSLFICACCCFQAFFVFGYFKADVHGESMYPTLNHGDVLIVNSTRNVQRFDIVIVEYDPEFNVGYYTDDNLLVKRLIGIGGDNLIYDNNNLYINGQLIKEKYISSYKSYEYIDLSSFVGRGVYYDEVKDLYFIEDGYYFLMGDNRGRSADSRDFGLFSKKQVIGKVSYRVQSLFSWEKYNGVDFK